MGETSSKIRGILGIQDPLEVVAFRAAPTGILLCDSEGIIYISNRRAEEILRSPYPLQGADVSDFVPIEEHREWVRNFVNHPSRMAKNMAQGRVVTGHRLDGEDVNLTLCLGHTMYDGVRLAIASFAEASNGS